MVNDMNMSSRVRPATSMLETKCVADNFEMLVMAAFVTNILYLPTLVGLPDSSTNIYVADSTYYAESTDF